MPFLAIFITYFIFFNSEANILTVLRLSSDYVCVHTTFFIYFNVC